MVTKCTTWCSTRKLHFAHRGGFDAWSSLNVGRVVPPIRPVCLYSLFVREYKSWLPQPEVWRPWQRELAVISVLYERFVSR